MQLTEETVGPLTRDPMCSRHAAGISPKRRRRCAPRVRLTTPCVEGSVWNNFLYRRSYIDLNPKTAATASEGSSSSTIWMVAGVVARVVRRSRCRTVEE